jgi:hypothetical protein
MMTVLELLPRVTALVVVPVPMFVAALLLTLMFVVPVTVFVVPATVLVPPAIATVLALLPMETVLLVDPVPIFVAALLLALMFVMPATVSPLNVPRLVSEDDVMPDGRAVPVSTLAGTDVRPAPEPEKEFEALLRVTAFA